MSTPYWKTKDIEIWERVFWDRVMQEGISKVQGWLRMDTCDFVYAAVQHGPLKTFWFMHESDIIRKDPFDPVRTAEHMMGFNTGAFDMVESVWNLKRNKEGKQVDL
jgi:hypothetical protein